jgi:hypothetical protein
VKKSLPITVLGGVMPRTQPKPPIKLARLVYLTGYEAAQPGYSTLGCEWLGSKNEAIAWGKQVEDSRTDGD